MKKQQIATYTIIIVIILAMFINTRYNKHTTVPSYSTKSEALSTVVEYFRYDICSDWSYCDYDMFTSDQWENGSEGLIATFVKFDERNSSFNDYGQNCKTSYELDSETFQVTFLYTVTIEDPNFIELCSEQTQIESVWTATAVKTKEGHLKVNFKKVSFEEYEFFRSPIKIDLGDLQNGKYEISQSETAIFAIETDEEIFIEVKSRQNVVIKISGNSMILTVDEYGDNNTEGIKLNPGSYLITISEYSSQPMEFEISVD